MVEIEGRVRISRLGATLVHFEFMGIGRAAAIATVWDDFVYYFDSRKKQKTKSPKSQKEDLIDVDDTLDVKTTAESLSIDENDVDDDSFIDVQSDDSDSSIDSEAAFKALSMQREKPIVKGKNKGSNGAGYSSEEEKWLDAVEEGRLEEDMLLKRMKDPKSMTARQKARIDRPLDTHASVEISSKPVLTEEQEEKRAARARERKKVVDVRKEEEKVNMVLFLSSSLFLLTLCNAGNFLIPSC
ncbi:hypothetical protein QYM36_008934 [Artemia franciscana]|uniref:Uncharacterized protein n=1 Tax=Artemia franciscana TaxID=6661 RepID=A0AA88L0N4_ARTSF|nr:hypothetical protein QYM36_008934 [Artemia franciscana]